MRRCLLTPALVVSTSLGVAPGVMAQGAPAERQPAVPAPAGTLPAAGTPPGGAPVSPEVERRLRELEETVRRQDELIRRLEETVEKLSKPGAAPGTPAPPGAPGKAPGETPGKAPGTQPAAGDAKPAAPDGFVIPGKDSGFRLRLRGFLQADARVFPTERGRTGVESFLLRRIRPVFTGTVNRYVEFTIHPFFDEGRVGVLDAFVDVRQAPQLQFRFGLFKTPFSLERLQSGSELQFIERSIAQNLAPNRDTGFMLHGETLKGRLAYAAAVLNGAPDGANVYGDLGRDKEFAGRVFARPFLEEQGSFFQGLGLGLAATYGDRDEPFQVTFRTDSREPFFTYASDTSYAGAVMRLSPQFHHYYRQLGLMGEAYLTRETIARGGVAAPIENYGWFLQGSYVLTGENATFRNVTPRRPFDPARGRWGAVELALRYSQVRADREAFRLGFADPALAARTADSWTLGLNWYLNNALKFQVNYERTRFNAPITFRTGPHDLEELIMTRFQLVY